MSSRHQLKPASQLQEIEPADPMVINGSGPSYGPRFGEQSGVLLHWQIFRKRRWYVLGTLAVVLGISAIISLASTRIYQASSKLAIFPESASPVDFKDAGTGTSAGDNELALQTQASILLSDTLALKAIDSMHLERDPRFVGTSQTGPSPDVARVDEHTDPHTMGLLRKFHGGLTVEPV